MTLSAELDGGLMQVRELGTGNILWALEADDPRAVADFRYAARLMGCAHAQIEKVCEVAMRRLETTGPHPPTSRALGVAAAAAPAAAAPPFSGDEPDV